MSVRCNLCSHPDREAADRDLVRGEPSRALAAKYGVSPSTVQRHARNHLAASLGPAPVAATCLAEVIASAPMVSLRESMAEMREATLGVLRVAQKKKAHVLVLGAVARLERQWELAARHDGALGPEAQVNITLSPDWAALRTLILRTLELYPEARVAVATALAEREVANAAH